MSNTVTLLVTRKHKLIITQNCLVEIVTETASGVVSVLPDLIHVEK